MRKRSYEGIVVHHFREHSSIYLFVIVLFLMGVIFGAIIVNSLSIIQKEDLFYYLTLFFDSVANEKYVSGEDLFFQSFTHNMKYIGLIWLLGISIIGLPIILIMLFMKGMVVGFTVGFLVNQMSWNGFLLSFVAILPQNLIIIPLFIFASVLSISFSLKMIRRQFTKTLRLPILPIITQYFIAFLAVIAFIGIAAGIEAYISPSFMKAIIEGVPKNIFIVFL